MAFSDTVSETIFTTRKVMDHAFRRAKIPPQKITREYIDTARNLLFMELSRLANKGLVLWAIQTHILPLYYGKQTVPCPLGTVDILNPNLRKLDRLLGGVATASEGTADNAFDEDIDTACVQTIPAGWIQMQFDEAQQVTNLGILSGATGTWNFTIDTSDDGVTWTTVYTGVDVPVVDGEWVWWDVEGIVPAEFIRLKATAPTILDVRELVFANNPQEIPLAKINRDDYMNLPNKAFLGRPVQFYFDKQIRIPTMVVWPAPQEQYTFQQLTVTTQRYVMDPGTMTQELEIPQGWFLAIVTTLGYNLSLEIPESEADPAMLFQEMQRLMTDAWASQSDGAPTKITPNISPYTR